jgi:hypothetical protein
MSAGKVEGVRVANRKRSSSRAAKTSSRQRSVGITFPPPEAQASECASLMTARHQEGPKPALKDTDMKRALLALPILFTACISQPDYRGIVPTLRRGARGPGTVRGHLARDARYRTGSSEIAGATTATYGLREDGRIFGSECL